MRRLSRLERFINWIGGEPPLIPRTSYMTFSVTFVYRNAQPPFDWAEQCPDDLTSRSWPPIVGRGRGEVLELEPPSESR